MYLIYNSLIEDDKTGLAWKWVSVKPAGVKPPPLGGVNIATTANGKVYTFGGVLDVDEDEESLEGNFNNDLHMLDLATKRWWLSELKKKAEKSDKSQNASGDVELEEKEKPQGRYFDCSIF